MLPAGYYQPEEIEDQIFTTMVELKNQGAVGDRSSLPFLAAAINCILWFLYGFSPKGDSFILAIHLFGACFQVFYLIKFLTYCDYYGRMWGLVYVAIGAVCTLLAILFYSADPQRNFTFFQWVCSVCRLLPAVAPMFNLDVVYQQRNMNSMPPLSLSLISLANASMWAAFGCTLSEIDWFIVGPSVVGMLFDAVQVFLHFVLRPNGGLYQPLAE